MPQSIIAGLKSRCWNYNANVLCGKLTYRFGAPPPSA